MLRDSGRIQKKAGIGPAESQDGIALNTESAKLVGGLMRLEVKVSPT